MALSTPRLVLLVFGVLLVVCGISVGVSEAFKHDRTTTTTINRHIERVVVRAGTGKVHLEGTESQRVMVREQLQWLWREPTVHTSVHGATLTVSGSCPDTGPVNRCKADIDLAIPFDAEALAQAVARDEVEYVVELPGEGHETEVFFSDLSHEYVTINAEYTT